MEYIERARYVRISPRKAREVVFIVRKMTPEDALVILPHVNKRFATPLAKIIGVAINNAVNRGADRSALKFKEIQVSDGPRMKRFRPGSRGAAKPYVKKMSHIRIVLEAGKAPKALKAKPVKVEKKGAKPEKAK